MHTLNIGQRGFPHAAIRVAMLLIAIAGTSVAGERPSIAWIAGGGGASALAVSSDGQTIATSSGLNETALKLWRIDGAFVRTLPALSEFWSAAFAPDGQTLVAGRAGIAGDTTATAAIYRVSDGAVLRGLNAGQTNNLYIAYGVDYAAHGGLVAVAYNSYRGIELYNAASGALVRTIGDGGYAARFSPDGQALAAARNGNVRLWRISDGAMLMDFPTGGSLLSFSTDGALLAIGQQNSGGLVKVFRISDGGLERTITPTRVQYPHSLAFAPNKSAVVIAGSRDAAVPIPELNLLSDEAIQQYRIDGSLEWTYEHPYGIAFSAGFTPDGHDLMVAGGWATAVPPIYVEGGDDSIQRLRASDGLELAHFAGRRGFATGVAFSPDSRLFATAEFNTMQLWRVADGGVEYTFPNPASSVAFTPDGTGLVAAIGSIQIWSIPGYGLVREIANAAAIQAVVSPDGTRIGSAGGNLMKLWRFSDGALLWSKASNAGNATSVAISPDGQVLAAGYSGSTVLLRRTSDGGLLRSVVGVNAVDSIAFSPDGTMLAVAEQADGNNLKLYRTADGMLIRAFPGSQGSQTQSVAFTPDGETIVFSSGAKFIQFWRVADGALLKQFDQEMGTGYFPFLPVAVSPNGRYVGYGRQDSMVVMVRNPLFACVACDTNCDGSLNQFDIQPFVQLVSHAGTPCSPCAGDADGDGSLNQFDIQGFVDCLNR